MEVYTSLELATMLDEKLSLIESLQDQFGEGFISLEGDLED
tara:strand:- start:440 stop:562 length:123 start_codon:yes stop_codon:yes gene_type:complete